MKRVIGDVVYTDYPDKFAKKVDWWRTPEGLDLIKRWRCQGESIRDIAEKRMGIDIRTLRSWRKDYPEFDEVLTIGKEVTLARVEESLYQRAIGYDYVEQTYELVEGEMRLTKEVKKHMPPDVKAILHFLYNRDPQHWRAIQEPIESTEYKETVKDILIAMKEVAESGQTQVVSASEVISE